jgi:hypothetical protein
MSKKAKGAVIASPVKAAAPDMDVTPPRLVHPPQHRMHMDYAHDNYTWA